MKKLNNGILIFIIIAIVVCICIYYYQQRQPHYIISAAEEAFKESMIVPSSFKIKEVIFTAQDGEGSALLKYIYKNYFGSDVDGFAIINFASKKIKNNENSEVERARYAIFQEQKDKIKKGELDIEPFSKMSFVSASLNGVPLSEESSMLLSITLDSKSIEYKGPSLGGKIIELREDGKHKFYFPILRYIPEEIFPYKRN